MTSPVKRGKKVSDVQVAKLVEYMLQNRDFALGRFKLSQGKKKTQKKWDTLTQNLNKYGPMKNVKQWKTVWKDMRLRARKSNAEITAAKKVVGSKRLAPGLSDLHKKILSVIDNEGSEGLDFDKSNLGESTMTTRRKKEEEILVDNVEDIQREKSEIENNEDTKEEIKNHVTIGKSIPNKVLQEHLQHAPSMNARSRKGYCQSRQDSQQNNNILPQDAVQHSKQQESRRGQCERKRKQKQSMKTGNLSTNLEMNAVSEIATALNRVADGLFAIADVLNRNPQ